MGHLALVGQKDKDRRSRQTHRFHLNLQVHGLINSSSDYTGQWSPSPFIGGFFSWEFMSHFFFFFLHVSLLLGPSGRQKRKARGLGCVVDLTPTNDHNSTRTTEKPAFCLNGWKTIKISSKLSNKGSGHLCILITVVLKIYICTYQESN